MLLAMPNLLLANGSGVWQSNALQTIINFTSGPFMKAKNECLALLKPQEQTISQNNTKENEKPIQGVDYEM